MTEHEPSTEVEATGARWRWPGRFLRDLNMVALLVVLAAAAALFMSPRTDDVLLGLPDLKIGDRSPRTIRSPRALNIIDPDTTQQMRDEAARRVAPVFDQEVWLVEHGQRRVETAFAVLARGESEPDADARLARRAAFTDALGLVLGKVTVSALMDGRPDELRDAVLSVLTTVGERPIVARSRDLPADASRLTVLERAQDERPVREVQIDDLSTVLTLDQARALVDRLAAERLAHLPRQQRRAVAMLAKELLEDNLVRNAAETRRRRSLARESVKAVVIAISPGEVVVRSGAPVDEQKLRILRGMASDLRATSRLQVTIGGALLVVLLVVFAYRLIARAYRPDRPAPRDHAFLATAVLLTLLSLWAGYHGVTYLVDYTPWIPTGTLRMGLPVAFGALLVRLVAGAEAAAIFTPVAAVVAGWIMDASLAFAIYTVAGGLAAASIGDGQRLMPSLLSATSRIILAQAAVVSALDLLDSSLDFNVAAEHLAAATASGVGSALLCVLVLPLVEAVFGYATCLRVGQLANLNHPLLKQLLVEAPGTYHHSIMVGTMAEAAARAIGARPLLARVGGYYHDIGKLKNPRAFEENEARAIGVAHSPAEARELCAHVSDGVELAYQHRLGAAVIDILRQHHGTAQVGRCSARGAAEIGADALRYPGPKPRDREAGLVMLADNVEASTRHLDQELLVERPRIERAVADAVSVVVQHGQLDACTLSHRDLDQTRVAFVEVLEARYSRRGRSLSTLPEVTGAPLVRAPGGEPN